MVVTQSPGLTVATIGEKALPFGYGTIPVITGSVPAASIFAGRTPFGQPMLFSVGLLDGKPSSVDAWLGLAPGRTVVGAGSGRHWGIAGTFWDSSSAAVQADFAALAALCGPNWDWYFPTGETCAFTAWRHRVGVRIVPGELVADPAGPQPPGPAWSLKYWAVVRDPQTL